MKRFENRNELYEVPFEFADATQSHNDVGAGKCFIRWSKVDLSKRQASLQVILRFRLVSTMTLGDFSAKENEQQKQMSPEETYNAVCFSRSGENHDGFIFGSET